MMSERQRAHAGRASASEPDGDGARGRSPRTAMLARLAPLIMVAGLAAGCGDDEPEVEAPDGSEINTISAGVSAPFADGDVTVEVGDIEDDMAALTVTADGDEVTLDGERGTSEEIGDFVVVVMDVDDDTVTVAVAESG